MTTLARDISEPLAVLGGSSCVRIDDSNQAQVKRLFHWPIVTEEDEAAVLAVLRAGTMSGTAITKEFEAAYARWLGAGYGLGTCNGTAALLASMWACEVGAGTEIICPSLTYWASAMPALQLGATVNFAEIQEETLCLDPDDIEHRIGPKTKAIVVVHWGGHPCDMDRIMAIARRHNVRVIEDCSHAQGALYKGKKCGTLGDIAATSLMAGKSFAAGEAGIVTTDDPILFERCVAFGHYERTGANRWSQGDPGVSDPMLQQYVGTPLGGVKHRMNQTCAAMGLVQLKHYPERMAEIQKAMNYFWDLLKGVPGVRAIRPSGTDSTMGGWYSPNGLYRSNELGGLPLSRFCEAVRAEGVNCYPNATFPLHLRPVFHEADIFKQGSPTVLAFGQRDVVAKSGQLPVTEGMSEKVFSIPWFKHDEPEWIERYAMAYRKVAGQAGKL